VGGEAEGPAGAGVTPPRAAEGSGGGSCPASLWSRCSTPS
jgi:hypothetical protein